MTDVAAQIMGEGRSIALSNGTTVQIRYGMKELKKIEQKFGSLQAMLTELQKGQDGMVIGTMCDLLWIGVVGWAGSEDEFMDHLKPQDIGDYVGTVSAALQEAFPPQTAQGISETTQSPSLGPDSIGSQPSDLVAPMSSSGG